MNPLLVSSTVFLLPAAYSAWCFNWPYALLSLNLYISSQLYHNRYCRITYIYDQIAIVSHWVYGVYLCYPLPLPLSAHYWAVTLYLWLVYYYGYVTKSMAFHPEHKDWWHMTIHYAGALAMILTQHALIIPG